MHDMWKGILLGLILSAFGFALGFMMFTLMNGLAQDVAPRQAKSLDNDDLGILFQDASRAVTSTHVFRPAEWLEALMRSYWGDDCYIMIQRRTGEVLAEIDVHRPGDTAGACADRP